MRLTSSSKYNLTVGGYNDENISLTPLGYACVAPQDPSEAQESLMKAAATPEIFRDFYRLLDGKRMPEQPYAVNVLIREMSVHPDLAPECLETITANGLLAGILKAEGQELLVDFDEMATRSEYSGGRVQENQRPEASEVYEPQPDQAAGLGMTAPRVFAGLFEPTPTIKHTVEMLGQLGLNMVSRELDAESITAVISGSITEAMQDCVAAVVFGGYESPDTTATRLSQQRGIWLLLGAAASRYGENVVLVEPTTPDSDIPSIGVKTVEAHPARPEATALSVFAALAELGAITVVAGPQSDTNA